jgi:hypothetical protein
MCQNCSITPVCDAHGHLHRDNELRICYPVEIVVRNGVGRCMVATRDIQPGELVMRDVSAALGPREHHHQQQQPDRQCCQCCQQISSTSLQKCICDLDVCCSHSELECRMLQRSSKFFEDESIKLKILTPLRLYLAQMEDRDLASRIDMLMDHNEDSHDKEGDSEKADILCDIIDDKEAKTDLMRCIGLLKTNALEVCKGRGRAIFPLFSFLSHSCVNNAKHILQPHEDGIGQVVSVYSQCWIAKGQEITITYTNLMRPTLERRAKLEYLWHFCCQCSRCKDTTEMGTYIGSVKCPTCRCRMDIDIDWETFYCNKCELSFPHSTVDKMVGTFSKILTQITNSGQLIKINDLEQFLSSTEKILEANHYLRIIAKRYLSQLSNGQRKIVLCQDLLDLFDKLDPGLSHSRGMTLYELFLATNEDKYLKEIINCLKVDPFDSLAGQACHKIQTRISLQN